MNRIVTDMTEREYLSLERCSHSRLRTLGTKSPAHLRAELDEPSEPTDSQILGTATHYAVLQPDVFDERVIEGPCHDRRAKAWIAAASDTPARSILLRPKDYDAALYMRDAVYAHEAARSLLDRATARELTVLWDHDEGVACKARIDLLVPELAMTVELKTAHSAARSVFERALFNFAYYSQGAWYMDAINAVQSEVRYLNHAIIAVEPEAPYAVNAFLPGEDVIQLGRQELRPWVRIYADCIRTGVWPTESHEYSQMFRDISLPPWGAQKIEERTVAI